MDFRKTTELTIDITPYPVYNPDPNVIKAQIQEYGWDTYPGQILYWTPKPGVYPKCRFHAVLDDAQSQSELGVYKLSNIQNKWTSEKIFDYHGTFENDAKRQAFKDKIYDNLGPRGTGVLVLENPSGEDLNVIKDTEIQNTDKLFEFTSKDVKNSIRESMALPAEVMGTMPEGGMFNKQQIEEAYTFTNAMTQGDRSHIERVFKKIVPFLQVPPAVGSYKILPQKYFGSAPAPSAAPAPGQPGAPAAPGQPAPPPVARIVDETLSSLSAKQTEHLIRITRLVERGKMHREAGKVMLQSFGFTDEEINKFLPEGDDL
jgi:hypothetical protein